MTRKYFSQCLLAKRPRLSLFGQLPCDDRGPLATFYAFCTEIYEISKKQRAQSLATPRPGPHPWPDPWPIPEPVPARVAQNKRAECELDWAEQKCHLFVNLRTQHQICGLNKGIPSFGLVFGPGVLLRPKGVGIRRWVWESRTGMGMGTEPEIHGNSWAGFLSCLFVGLCNPLRMTARIGW